MYSCVEHPRNVYNSEAEAEAEAEKKRPKSRIYPEKFMAVSQTLRTSQKVPEFCMEVICIRGGVEGGDDHRARWTVLAQNKGFLKARALWRHCS